MAYNEQLAARLREALEHIPDVEEKRMFRGVTFMVDGKMCVNVSGDNLMCRIDPAIYEAQLERPGCHPVIMKNRPYVGYVYVDSDAIKTKKQLDYWVQLCLQYNKIAKAAKKKSKGANK